MRLPANQTAALPEIQGFFALFDEVRDELRKLAAGWSIEPLLERLRRRLREMTRDDAEAFLSRSTDHADLERRIHALLLLSDVLVERHLRIGLERSGLHLSRTARQQFHASLRSFQLLAAGSAQRHPTLEQLQRALERQVSTFHFFDDRFQLLQPGFKGQGRSLFRHRSIIAQLLEDSSTS